jgi:hypothetical protein
MTRFRGIDVVNVNVDPSACIQVAVNCCTLAAGGYSLSLSTRSLFKVAGTSLDNSLCVLLKEVQRGMVFLKEYFFQNLDFTKLRDFK